MLLYIFGFFCLFRQPFFPLFSALSSLFVLFLSKNAKCRTLDIILHFFAIFILFASFLSYMSDNCSERVDCRFFNNACFYSRLSHTEAKSPLLMAPTLESTTSPFLMPTKAGMLVMRYF